MIDLYYWPTTNCQKILIFLEESKLPYQISPINIGRGEQHTESFQKISPNGKIPVIIDRTAKNGDEPICIFESGAILLYLAEKYGRFLPVDVQGKYEVTQWLFWQVSGLGPAAGQTHHFLIYADEKLEYPIKRFVNETARLYRVLDNRLADRKYIAQDYSIADMACYPWVALNKHQNQDIDQFPNLKRWLKRLANRPAIKLAEKIGKEVSSEPLTTDRAKQALFGNRTS